MGMLYLTNLKGAWKLCFYLALLVSFSETGAQSEQVRFEHITTEEGLSENVINCIFQDSRGFMWIGTDDGLNRFDGYNFEIFRSDGDREGAINSNIIYDIAEDSRGDLWIGTTGWGINHFDPITEKFSEYRASPSDPNSLIHDHIMSLYVDTRDRVWVGTFDGLSIITPSSSDRDSLTFYSIKLDVDGQRFTVEDIIEDPSGVLWLATTIGLFTVELVDDGHELTRVSCCEGPDNSVEALTIDADGWLVVVTKQGLFQQKTQGKSPRFKKGLNDGLNSSIAVDDQGNLWAGGLNGLFKYSVDEQSSYSEQIQFTAQRENPTSLNDNVVRCIYKDQFGIIWVGTGGGGINKFDPDRKPFFHLGMDLVRDGRRYTKIRSIVRDQSNLLWIGTEGGGLFKEFRNSEEGAEPGFRSIGLSHSIFVLEEVHDSKGIRLLAGSPVQPFLQEVRVAGSEHEISNVDSMRWSVFSLLQDRDSTLWLGSYNWGLFRKENEKNRYEQFVNHPEDRTSLANNIVRSVIQDRGGHIWIGTANGLSILPAFQTRASKPAFINYHYVAGDSTSLSHNYILDLHQSKGGEIWIGTFGGGVLRVLDPNAISDLTFLRYDTDSGLPNNTIKCIEEDDDGNLWMASNRGLSKLNPITDKIENYSITDGLQGSEFLEGASFKDEDGRLYFGGVNGINVFNPAEIYPDTDAPILLFTKLTVNGQEIHPGQKVGRRVILDKSISSASHITLRSGQNDFSIEFAGIHSDNPKQHQYEYFLEGYHEQWVKTPADNRYATFTNLRHGNYVLNVRVSNGDGVWVKEPTSLEIKILPPVWLTWYAYLFYALLIGLALLLYRRFTFISIVEKNRLTLKNMEREKLEELNQMKLRFFTNISHELRTPLTLIIAPLENILEKGRQISAEQLQLNYHYMIKNAKYLLRLVNQLLDFRKLDQGSINLKVGRADLASFIHETTEAFQFLADKKNIHLKTTSSDEQIYTHFDPDVIEKVIYNLLSNAFKFNETGATISVDVTESNQEVEGLISSIIEIRVVDNGPGIAAKNADLIFQRFYKDPEQHENKNGTGIGLAYTKSLVELHRGTIELKSVLGGGSTFIVKLPRNKEAYLKSEIDQFHVQQFEPSREPLDYLYDEELKTVLRGPQESVVAKTEEELPILLFVDDNRDIRDFIKTGFRDDFRIVLATNGQEGLEASQALVPDIVVSDVMMPVMDGIELCHSLKTNALTSHIPVLLLTAKSTSENTLEGLEIGADAYVVKPFKLDILRAQLKNIYLQRERLKQRFRQELILEPKDVTVTSVDEEFLKNAVTIVREHMSDSEFNVEALVQAIHISRSNLYLKLKALTGQSSSEFIRSIRLKRAVQLLEESNYTIKEVMYMTGFSTASYFSKCFKKQVGMVPSDYIRQKRNAAAAEAREFRV